MPGALPEAEWLRLWGASRGGMGIEELALEALAGWEPTNCGSGVVRGEGGLPVAMVHNIVSTSFLQGDPYDGASMPINLQLLSLCLPFSSYNRRRFAAITIRIASPRCTALLFTSGKLVVTGVRSWYECVLAALCISRMVSGALPGKSYRIMNCEIQNIVARSEVLLGPGQALDIQSMYETHSIDCTFQRNMFPGLIYRMGGCPVVLLCFSSGKVVLTGGKTVEDIEVGWGMLWGVVRNFVR